ncbi:MAG TPA: hypothetical protein PKC18_14855 [Lacipirellulaceae bacterium]|nr:hypothetical protein [Lacipirellulaceae bacterium]
MMKTACRRLAPIAAALAMLATLVAAAPSFAGPLNPDHIPSISIRMGESDTAPQWRYAPGVDRFRATDANGGGYEMTSSSGKTDIFGGNATVEILELQFDPDPFVLNNILVTNNTASTQIFTAFVGLPVPPMGAPNIIKGNVRTDVIDGGLDGATIASMPGFPIYAAVVDFLPVVATLQNDPFTLTAPVGMSAGSNASFGPQPSGVPVTNNIGIQLRFTLTAGDTASILSRFDVVPEPSGAGLALVGAALVLRRRRR